MSGYLIAEVWCDLCGERAVAEDEGTLRQHRADLRDAGWQRRRMWWEGEYGLLDVCPDCQEDER